MIVWFPVAVLFCLLCMWNVMSMSVLKKIEVQECVCVFFLYTVVTVSVLKQL